MNVRIGPLEITNISADELDMLIKRYGKVPATASTEQHSNKIHAATNLSNGSGNGDVNDVVALKKLVEAGDSGMKTNDIGQILGKRGKSARPAIKAWARRIGLTKDGDTSEATEDCRVGTSRGVRIMPNLLDVAKMLAKKHE
jgi:hypothetical protein